MDEFAIHYKVLRICEDLMLIRRRIEQLTPEETEYAVSILERLVNDVKSSKDPH